MKALFVLGACVFLSGSVQASVSSPVEAIVKLANGDEIHARVTLRTEDELTPEHPVPGELKIKKRADRTDSGYKQAAHAY